MQLVDLSREIYHKLPRIMTHPPIIMTPFGTHQDIREADGYRFPPPPSHWPWVTTPART